MNMIEFCWCFDVVVLLLFSMGDNEISDVSPLYEAIESNSTLKELE